MASVHQGICGMCPLALELEAVGDCLESGKYELWSWDQYSGLLLYLN